MENKTESAELHVREERVQLSEKQMEYFSKENAGIDWGSLLFRLLEKIHWILIAAVVGGAVATFYVNKMVTPVYQALSKLYIAGSETTISLSDLQLGSTLAKDYQEVFKIWHVHEMVDEKLGLDYSYSKLGGMVSVRNPDGSHLLYITVTSTDPEEARQIADAYAEVVQDFIVNKMELRKPQVLEKAQLPKEPISPDVKGTILKGFIGSGMAAAAVVLVLILLDDKIRTSDDVEKNTNLVTLGTISLQNFEKNAQEAKKMPRETDDLGTGSGRRAIFRNIQELDYKGVESVNTICSTMSFAGVDTKIIAFTSSEANNGKTFVTLQIAIGMAKRGKKVLLMDADLRNSVLCSRYNVELHPGKTGLAHFLSGQCDLRDTIYGTSYPNLFLLPVGETVKTPLPLLTASRFANVMETLKEEYDLVIVDTPPIGMVIDAAEISKSCDGAILVLEYNRTSKRSLRDMEKLLDQTKTPVMGCVINKVPVNKLSAKYYYSEGKYGYGYGEETKKKKKWGLLSRGGKGEN